MLKQARRVIGAQALVTTVISATLALAGSRNQAVSAFIGGAIGFVPAWLYAWRMTAWAGGDPRSLLRAQHRAEFYKLAATLGLFALTFIVYRDVAALPLFLTYLAALLVYWVALVL